MANLDLILSLVVGFALLVFFHELGHFLFAKLFGMHVEEFALGMGNPKLRVYHDGETEYTLRAFPLGGFVRIRGMEIEDEAERKLSDFGGRRKPENDPPSVADEMESADFTTTNIDTLNDPRGFNNRPIWQRFLVILAGPVFSLLLGWFVLSMIGVTVGIPSGKPSTRLAVVVSGDVADQAGLHAGDRVTAINGVVLSDGDEMVKTIRASAGKPLSFQVQTRKGESRTMQITPKARELDGKTVGLIGVQPDFERKRVSLGESFAVGTEGTMNFYKGLLGVFRQGKVQENIGGPIAIVKMTRQAVDSGPFYKLSMLGQLSLSLAFFNMLPIPILDGGHLVLFTLEAIRGKKLSAVQTQRVLLTGLALLMLFMAFVFVNDITRLFTRG